jgi:hypothetical protein
MAIVTKHSPPCPHCGEPIPPEWLYSEGGKLGVLHRTNLRHRRARSAPCPHCEEPLTPTWIRHESARARSLARKTFAAGPGRNPGVAMPCGWCGELQTSAKLRAHWTTCHKKPAPVSGPVLMRCGWCRAEQTVLGMRAHFTICPKRPKEKT